MAIWRQDLIYALRRMHQAPGFAAAAVISIGLGIGANSTIFSMVSSLILRTAPVGNPATLVSLYSTEPGVCCNNFSWLLYTDVRDRAKSFSGVAAYYPLVPASIGGQGAPERIWGQAATANFFDVAQLPMAEGRGFTGDEERLPVIVLSHRLWERRFGADPAIAGKSILLSGRPFTVVGVAPASFRGLDLILDAQFWVPLGNVDQLVPRVGDRTSRASGWLEVAARLRPGVSVSQAGAELAVLGQRVSQSYPDTDKGRSFHFEQAGSLPPRYKTSVRMFLAGLTVVVLLVLGIACANVANLLLAQASGRRREMALRLALGASRSRLLRQMLTESVLLALGGGMLGVALALWATRALSRFRLPVPIPVDLRVAVDGNVLLYTFLVSVGAGILFGLAPAWAASSPTPSPTLRRRWSLRNLLVVSQIAMSLVLLCATGLFLRSLESAAGIDIGFRTRGVLTMAVDPALHGYSAQHTLQFLTQLRERVINLPGVASAGWTDTVPLSMGGRRDGFHVEGKAPAGGVDDASVDLYMATPGYFDAMGMPRIAGRDFGSETPTAPKVAVVNEAFAQRLFGNENPIGQRVTGPSGTYQIIGLVKNIKSRTLGEELRPVLYRSLAQDMGGEPSFLGYSLLVRASGDTTAVVNAVRREIRTIDPTLAIFNAGTMDQHVQDALFLPRLASTLFGICGGVGLLLAAVGLYGVMSYVVSGRRREIGIRLALGAQSGAIQRMIVGQGMLMTTAAVVVGLGGALAAAKLATTLLYGVRPHDLLTFTAAPLFLIGVARVEPLTALRYE
jgi:predicted permease